MIINPETGRKGSPDGHVPLTRIISVPVMMGDQVVAIIANANKEEPYDKEDEKALTTLAHIAWELLFHRKSEKAIRVNEQRLKKAQRIAGFESIIYDDRTKSVLLSDEMFQICGIDRSIWTGRIEDYLHSIHPDDRKKVRKSFHKYITDGEKGDIEQRILRSDGTVRWVHGMKETIIDEEGNHTGIEGIILDITERKHSEEERLKSLNQISRNLETLGVLNDQIRNPLAIITAVCDIEPGQYTETILKAVQDIDAIVEQLDKGWVESEKVRSYLKRYHEF